jgi:nucleotide-binding universal stress UspA family protein
MTTIVAYRPGTGGREALHLGALIANSNGSRLLVAAILPTPGVQRQARVDHEYLQLLHRRMEHELQKAKALLPPGVQAEFVVHPSHSAAAGLIELVEKESAEIIVVGNSGHGVLGQVTLGSVTNHLVHSSPVPVALASRGFRIKQDGRLARVTAAYGGAAAESGLVIAAAGFTADEGAQLRLASFVVRPYASAVAAIGTDANALDLQLFEAEVREDAGETLAAVRALPNAPQIAETAVGFGETWADAIADVEWERDEVLVVGSSDMGSVHRVFLGSSGMRIVRASPVPVIVVPRGAVEALAEKAVEPAED